jgi:DNA-directed RNA polymerase subunit F
MDEIEKLLEQFARPATRSSRAKHDYQKVVEYARKNKRFITVSEVSKTLGIPYNYVRQFLERKAVPMDKAKELVQKGAVEGMFLKYEGMYLLLEHLVKEK